MYGAIIGDIVGSRFETMNCRSKAFHLFNDGRWNASCFTDDTVMTVAVAEALMTDGDFVGKMQKWGRKYPKVGYGGMFLKWIMADDPQPYGSWGNGSAMRVSPCGLLARSMEEALELAERSAIVSHDHPEAVCGTQAVAAAIYLAKTGSGKGEIRAHIRKHYYPMDQTLEEIRPGYRFDSSCRGSVPQAIQAFLESVDFEDAIRNAVSIGGDSDTIAAIAGSIAWAFYSREQGPTAAMLDIWAEARNFLPADILRIVTAFSGRINPSV